MKVASGPIDGAWQLLSAGRFEEASRLADKILGAEPDNPSALVCRGMAGWAAGHDIVSAIADLRRAASLAPQAASIHHNLATLLAADGQIEAAVASFSTALDLKPEDTLAFYGLSQNHRFTTREGLVDRMLALYGSGTLTRRAREFLCFGLAKAFDDLGDPAQAIHFCLEANWLAERPYDMDAARARFAALEHLAESGALAKPARGHPSNVPVFIMGAPRSGTTLMETILSRHPDVWPNGESERIAEIEQRLTRGDISRLPSVNGATLKAEGETLLRAMRGTGGATARILTDKTPGNVFHLATIARLFPNARVIFMRRHPMDCGISNLFVRFAEGQGFAFHQAALGQTLRQIADLMAIWKKTLPLSILDVSYERLVSSPEAETRRILDFLGLDWNEACLSPEKSRYQVQTASQFQVRQKIHSNSVGRFQSYRQWLAALVDALGGEDWIAAEFADQTRER